MSTKLIRLYIESEKLYTLKQFDSLMRKLQKSDDFEYINKHLLIELHEIEETVIIQEKDEKKGINNFNNKYHLSVLEYLLKNIPTCKGWYLLLSMDSDNTVYHHINNSKIVEIKGFYTQKECLKYLEIKQADEIGIPMDMEDYMFYSIEATKKQCLDFLEKNGWYIPKKSAVKMELKQLRHLIIERWNTRN